MYLACPRLRLVLPTRERGRKMDKQNYYNVETEDGITYHVFATSKLDAAKQVTDSMDPDDEILEVTQVL